MSRPLRRLRPPWLLAGVLLVLFAVLLVIAGFAEAEVGVNGDTHEPGPDGQVPASVQDGGPIIHGTNPIASADIPAKSIALTFDDGPDPTWTRQVLSILTKYHVPATFFVVGSRASRHPELIKAIHDSGSEIGSHTFTHPDLSDVPQLRLDRELDETQLVLAGSAGISTYLFRPPYSSNAGAVDDADLHVLQAAGSLGYITVLTSADSGDWQRPGVPAIVHNATPSGDAGEVVLMHDAGGDRSQTVAALDQLIPMLQQQGYRFTTVTAAAGLPPANRPASAQDLQAGAVLLDTIEVAIAVVDGLQLVLVGVGVLVAARLVLMLVLARRAARAPRKWGPQVAEPVTVLVPAHNEREDIAATVRSILANYHPLEIVVVDDGSTDGTAEIVEALGEPRVRVVRQRNAGKAAALNTGIAAARHELVVMLDGDTVFAPDTVRQLVQPFADPSVGAVAGHVKIAHKDTVVARLQHIEYVIGFGIDRRVQDRLGGITTIPGAAGAYRRRVLRAVGGLSTDTIAEDTDLTIAIGRAGWRVVYQDSALAWTEAPATLTQLWRQRYRWSYGTMQAMWKHRAAVLQRGASGRVGRRGLGHAALFHVLLPLTAPLIDVFFLYGLVFLDPVITMVLWSSMLLLQLAGAAYAFRLDGESRSALWVLPLQQLVYRQLMYAVLVQSVCSAVSGARVRWRASHRAGGLDAIALGDSASNPATVAPVTPPRLPGRHRPKPGPEQPAGGRERWLDVLRVAALGQAFAYHLLGAGWLTLVFPAPGVLFGIAGSLLTRSLRTTPAVDVVGHRLRRLLPPLWVLAAIVVPVMIWQGWSVDSDPPLSVPAVLDWLVPVVNPPTSDWGAAFGWPLWFASTYLWLVLLTPALLRVTRRWPVGALVVPLGVVAADAVVGSPLSGWTPVGPVVLQVAVFVPCWLIGVAHRDGLLRRLPVAVVLAASAVAIAAGLAWALAHPTRQGIDLTDDPLGQALISVGLVTLLLRASPGLARMDGLPVVGRLVTGVNRRAMTIFAWSAVAVSLAGWLVGLAGWPSAALPAVALGVLAVAVLAFGWVEDFATGRQMRLLPRGAAGPGGYDQRGRPPARRGIRAGDGSERLDEPLDVSGARTAGS